MSLLSNEGRYQLTKATFEATIGNVRGRNAADRIATAAASLSDGFTASRTFFIEGRPRVVGKTIRFTAGYETPTGDSSDVRRKAERLILRALPTAKIAVQRVA